MVVLDSWTMNDTYEGPRGKLARRLKGEPVWALESWSEANLEIRARMMLKEEIPVSLLQVALSRGFGVESLAVWAGLSGCSLKEQLGELLLLTERAGESRLGKAVLELKDELAYWDEVNHGRPWSKANSRGRPEPGQVELIERERKEIQRRLMKGRRFVETFSIGASTTSRWFVTLLASQPLAGLEVCGGNFTR